MSAGHDVFVSHSSRNRTRAGRVAAALSARGLRVWLDDSEIRLGVLLGKELQDNIRDSRVLLLLWSRTAASSRWVQTEWLTAFHVGRFVVPCVLDVTPLPQCLRSSVFLRLRDVGQAVVQRLATAIREAPDERNPVAPVMRAASPALERAVAALAEGQRAVTDALGERDLATATQAQERLAPATSEALATWEQDPVVLNLAGYHLKNAYLIRHWEAVQSGRAPEDPLLRQAEWRFFETLTVDPSEPSALNGLGSILMLERDLDAAEFFIRVALAEADRRGFAYRAAEHDLEQVLRVRSARRGRG